MIDFTFVRRRDVACFVCMLVGHDREPCKKGWTDQNAVWEADSRGPKDFDLLDSMPWRQWLSDVAQSYWIGSETTEHRSFLSICNIYNYYMYCVCWGDQLWWWIPSGSLPLYCFSLQLLFFYIAVNKISIYICILPRVEEGSFSRTLAFDCGHGYVQAECAIKRRETVSHSLRAPAVRLMNNAHPIGLVPCKFRGLTQSYIPGCAILPKEGTTH